VSVAGIDWRFIAATIGRLTLPLWFAIYGALTAANLVSNNYQFIDIEVYRTAAAAALAGQDPWAPQPGALAFAGPPPTLLLFAPLTFVPLEVAILVATSVFVAAAIFAVRRLQLPLWWILFPPVLECLIVGNPDVLVLAFLLARGPMAGLAVVAKVYGIIPLLYQRRWGAVAMGCALSAVTLPLWPDFFASLAAVEGSLDAQSEGFSSWGTWWMLPTVVALWVLRRNGAEWLVVPGLWPHTQIHYAAMSLPVMRNFPIAAAIVGLGTPLAPVVAILVIALQVRFGVGPRDTAAVP
jgi:hypothetical protein